jgi:ribosomal protein L37E
MICDIPDNTRKQLDEPTEVQCRRCGAKYFVRLFPIRAECGLSEVGDFWQAEDDKRTGLGDVVEKIINTVTFGKMDKRLGCGCEQRKEWLNKFWSWKSGR